MGNKAVKTMGKVFFSWRGPRQLRLGMSLAS